METHPPASTAPSPHLASLQVDAGGTQRCMGAFLAKATAINLLVSFQELENQSFMLLLTQLHLQPTADGQMLPLHTTSLQTSGGSEAISHNTDHILHIEQ